MTTKRILVIEDCRMCPYCEETERFPVNSRRDWCSHKELIKPYKDISFDELDVLEIPDWCPLKKENE